MRKNIVLILVCVVVVSCTKIINVDLKTADQQLVIEGIITNDTAAVISIKKSVAFSSSNIYPVVSGATVSVTNNTTGAIFTLTEFPAGSGIYSNPLLIGKEENSYSLNVVAEGKTYTALSTMPKQVNLDTLLFEKIAFGSEYIWIVKPQYTDPDGFGNYYRFIEKINNVRNPTIWVWDDRFSNNGISTRPLIQNDSTINLNDSIEVEMNCLDKPIFRYFRGLQDLQRESATPANPETNISGGALGYFSAHTRQKRKQAVQ